MSKGYERKLERGWDYTRTLMAQMHNTAMGAKQGKRGVDIMKLPIIDRIGRTMKVKRLDPEVKHRFVEAYKQIQKNGS